jgi:hypothetical protein
LASSEGFKPPLGGDVMGIAALHPSWGLGADLPPWQIKFLHSGCGKSTRRANHFRFSEIVSSPKIKNISVFARPKSVH